MKKLTTRQFATIKRVAQNVNPLVVRKQKLIDKLIETQEEIESLKREIEGHEAGILVLTGGYSSEDLIMKVIENTDKVDAKGIAIKTTKYVPTNLVVYNEEENNYTIVDIVQDAEENMSLDEEATVPEVEVEEGVNPIASFE